MYHPFSLTHISYTHTQIYIYQKNKKKQYLGHAPATAALNLVMKALSQYDAARLLRRTMKLLKQALEVKHTNKTKNNKQINKQIIYNPKLY